MVTASPPPREHVDPYPVETIDDDDFEVPVFSQSKIQSYIRNTTKRQQYFVMK